MGFFSWNCKRCGHPMLSPYAINNINGWMNDVVVITQNGHILKGSYDGYGRVNDADIDFGYNDEDAPLCYHEACWKLEGKPTEHDGKGSENAADQGYFFDTEHDMIIPTGKVAIKQPKPKEVTTISQPEIVHENVKMPSVSSKDMKAYKKEFMP